MQFKNVPDLLVDDLAANAGGHELLGLEWNDAHIVIDVPAARALRDWLNTALPDEPEADPMPDMAHLDAVQLRRIIGRHVRFREEAVRLLQQVDIGYEGEWPEIRQFLERVNARLVLAQNRQVESAGEWVPDAAGGVPIEPRASHYTKMCSICGALESNGRIEHKADCTEA